MYMKKKPKKTKKSKSKLKYGNIGLEIEDELANDIIYNQGNKIKKNLASGGDPNLKDGNGDTALMWAIAARNMPLIKMLVTKGADINAKTTGGTSVFKFAARLGFHEICEYLISKKVKNEDEQVIEYIRSLIEIKL